MIFQVEVYDASSQETPAIMKGYKVFHLSGKPKINLKRQHHFFQKL